MCSGCTISEIHPKFQILFFPVSCHLGPKGPNGKIVLIRFVHVRKKYKTRVGDRQRKSGYCGILAQKVSVRPYARINYAPLSNLTMYTTEFKLNTAYAINLSGMSTRDPAASHPVPLSDKPL